MVRVMTEAEIAELLELDVPARVATIDADGYPHVTPLWFLWTDGLFHLTSFAGKPHLARMSANPKVGLVIDTEYPLLADGERPNRQVRVLGDAEILPDTDRLWTRRIDDKYVHGPAAESFADRRPGVERFLVRVRPRKLVTVASV